MYDFILSGGYVYDGLGNVPQYEDIGIQGGRITALGKLGGAACHCKLNLKGRAVTPGFIDIHSHSDIYYLLDSSATSKIRQGVTTEVIGNCGSSAAPLYGEYARVQRKRWAAVGVQLSWRSFRSYIQVLRDTGIAVNVVPLIGHGNIRGAVTGYNPGKATKKDLTGMRKLLRRGLKAGAFGLSSGLIYVPGMYAGTGELIDLARLTGDYGGIYATHIRGEGDNLLIALGEAVLIAEKTGVSLQISHLKTGNRANWSKIEEAFFIIEQGQRRGVQITADRYPYIASSTDLDVILPEWWHRMNYKKRHQWISNKQDTLAAVLTETLPDNWADDIMVAHAPALGRLKIEGLYLSQIAARERLSPEKTMLRLLQKTDFQAQAIFFCMNAGNLNKILRKPYVMIGSDSSLRTVQGRLRIGYPHPRTLGTFPRFLSKFTGKGKIPLAQAVYKITGLPAEKLGLKRRGRITKGAYADIVIFNPRRVRDTATYKKPFCYPEGIETVIVNGEIVFANGHKSGKLPGRVILKTDL